MFLNLLILSIILMAFVFVGLGINIIFKKDGKFPEKDVGHNPEMRKMGLSCAKGEALKEFQLQKKILATKKGQVTNPADFSGGCSGCSCS